MKRYGEYPFVVKRSHASLIIALLPILMAYGSACAIEKHINKYHSLLWWCYREALDGFMIIL